MKILYGLIFMLLATTLNAAELTGLKLLDDGDPLWYSNDGETWEQGVFIALNKQHNCEVDETGVDAFGVEFSRFTCSGDATTTEIVSYLHADGYTDFVVNYITAFDPNASAPSRAELYGFLTRVDNLLKADSITSFLGTLLGMFVDRMSLLKRVEAWREILKDE